MNLAHKLAECGVTPILDRCEFRGGSNAPYFMDTALKDSDNLLIIFTENYHISAVKRSGGGE